MARTLLRLPHKLDAKSLTCRAIVETPRGVMAKLNYDAGTGIFRLHALLPAGMCFPCNFGFVPATRAEDGDPLDIMILGDVPLPTGTLLDARLLGVIEAEQRTKAGGKAIRNDRLIGVPAVAETRREKSLADLPTALLNELCQFWVDKDRSEGKRFKVLRLADPDAATRLIRRAARAARRSRTRRRRPGCC
jgi:inorganic pyrophosphatase